MKTRMWLVWLMFVVCCGLVTQGCAPKQAARQSVPQISETKPSPTQDQPASQPVQKKQDTSEETDGLWHKMPVMEGSTLEETVPCPAKWAECGQCEQRIYVTDGDAEELCAFYQEAMPKQGWTKLVYQTYPEGACMGTWMQRQRRVLFTAGVRRGGKKTFADILVGQDCP